MDLELLRQHVDNGLVREQQHPTLPLSIYNYSDKCQFERLWDDVTLQCRGLVMHGDTIVARPFRKFFNDGEHTDDQIPWHLPCEVTEKLDGSLLIVFHFDGEWHFATRGSFTSEQAQRGKEIFERMYGHCGLVKSVTYLFEVIYPQNKIVVDYGSLEDVVLLAMIDTATGNELPLSLNADHDFTLVRSLPPGANAQDLRGIIRDDEEGYVVRFENGFRIKVKGERYMELHRLISGVSSRSVWEYLSEGKPFDEMLATIPDEFGDWIRAERAMQCDLFDAVMERTREAVDAVENLPDRKSQALKILAEFKDVSSTAFAMLDGKDVTPIIWRHLYPECRRPEATARLVG